MTAQVMALLLLMLRREKGEDGRDRTMEIEREGMSSATLTLRIPHPLPGDVSLEVASEVC